MRLLGSASKTGSKGCNRDLANDVAEEHDKYISNHPRIIHADNEGGFWKLWTTKLTGFMHSLYQPGLTNISTMPTAGLRAATASAKHPPRESPTMYIGVFVDIACSEFTERSTNSTSP